MFITAIPFKFAYQVKWNMKEAIQKLNYDDHNNQEN